MREVPIERVEPTAPCNPRALSRRHAMLAMVRASVAASAAGTLALRPSSAIAQDPGDVIALNALLTLEYATTATYQACVPLLTSPVVGDPLFSSAPTVLAVANHFAAQHGDQATQLAAIITAAGGTPVDPATVSFELPTGFNPTVLNVIRLAANTEQNAAVAFGAATGTLSVDDNSGLAANIGGVHAQQYTVLALLAQQVIVATGPTLTDVADVVPRSFVASPPSGAPGLETVPDFTYE